MSLMSGMLTRTSAEAVIVSLRDGLRFCNSIYKALIDADVDPYSGQCSDYKHIRKQIVWAERSLRFSEQVANAGLESLDQTIEILTWDRGRFEREKDDEKRNLKNLKSEQSSNEKLQRDCENALQQARSNLNSTKNTLRRQEERKRDAEIVTWVGVGVSIIPGAGWIAGPVIAFGGLREMEEASRSIRTAEKEVSNSKAQVEKYRSKVSEYEWKISETKISIRKKTHEIEEIHGKICEAKKQSEALTQFQDKARGAVHLLSVLSGKAHVVENQTRRFILQVPMMKVMEDLTKAAGDITGNQLLSKEGIPELFERMRENNRRLGATCASSSCAEYEDYC